MTNTISITKEGIVLEKSGLGFEVEGVLNPAVIKDGDYIHMLYRAVAKGNYSTIGYCKFKSPLEVEERFDTPIIFPQLDYERHGIEDPRIVKIDDLFYLTYTAFDGVNALGALATSTDLQTWKKEGLIVPKISAKEFFRLAQTKGPLSEKYHRYNEHQFLKGRLTDTVWLWDKNVVFFPRRINGKIYSMHRIKPDIQIVSFNELADLTAEFWQNYFLHFEENIVLAPKHKHEASFVGGGCPPIETEEGWLVIYHSVKDTVNGYVYSACVALLDLDRPQTEIARLRHPLFKPEHDWELSGEVNNVCFPTGAVVEGDKLYIYYGAADERIACVSMSLSELLEELMLNKNTL
jgi:predicted GH43/DUF377 family glycosyl hydrolase